MLRRHGNLLPLLRPSVQDEGRSMRGNQPRWDAKLAKLISCLYPSCTKYLLCGLKPRWPAICLVSFANGTQSGAQSSMEENAHDCAHRQQGF